MSERLSNGWSVRPRAVFVVIVVDWGKCCKSRDDEWAPYACMKSRIGLTAVDAPATGP